VKEEACEVIIGSGAGGALASGGMQVHPALPELIATTLYNLQEP
jgi:hypothetical protein